MATRGWKARDLADRIGIAQSAIYRWLDGTGAPSLDALDRVAAEFGTSAASLLHNWGERKPSQVPGDIAEILETFDKDDFEILRPTIRGIAAGKELQAGQKAHKLRKSKA